MADSITLPEEFCQFLINIGYEVVVEKGQRVFRPKDEDFETESMYDKVKKHEVFVSNLPYDLYEDELLAFLCRAGPVYQIRLLMNFSGSTKGMAYVVFTEVQSAFDAIDMLDGEYIRPGCNRRVRVSFSVNNNRLLVKDIPRGKSTEEVKEQLSLHVEGITKVKLFTDPTDNITNAMVSFESHKLAATARRALVPKGSEVKIFGLKLVTEWAKPKDFKTLFIRFNCSFFNQQLVKNFFETEFFETPIEVRHVTIQGQNAFVKFTSYSIANQIFKKYSQMPNSILPVKEFLEIVNISWPLRK